MVLDHRVLLLKTYKMLYDVALGFGLPFLSAFLATPLFGKLAIALNIVDRPGDPRLKIHRKPIPYLGGAAIFIATTIALILKGKTFIPVLIPASIVFVLGLVDDIRGVAPWLRLAVESLVAVLFLITLKSLPVYFYPVFFLLIVGSINSVNLIDGLDGLAAGSSVIALLGFTIISLFSRDFSTFYVCLALLGATLAFLYYNFHPARIFLGDAGSYFLGFMLAALAIYLAKDLRNFLASLSFLGLFAMDTSLAIVRRKLSGKPIFIGDRSHFYDQVMDRKGSHLKAVLISYSIEAIFVLYGLLIFLTPTRMAVPLFLLLWVLVWGALLKGNFIRKEAS